MSSDLAASRAQIAELIPHADDMVLIDEVMDHDPTRISCRTRLDPTTNHPLAINGSLPATALAEYAAQAMAVHGGLLASPGAEPRPGRLVALGQLDLGIEALSEPLTLDIQATRLGGDEAGHLYDFEVHHADNLLARGRATIMFADR
jgi:predicted hotdog family 3-hydroxylacyl-ACP dehydratase